MGHNPTASLALACPLTPPGADIRCIGLRRYVP
jgi:hypothetical protein